MSDNANYKARPSEGRKVAVSYLYFTRDGDEIFKDRTEPKGFYFRRLVNGKTVYSIKGLKLLPYRWEECKEASSLIIAEGEKDTQALAALGFAAVCAPFGASSWPEHSTPLFKEKLVYIAYDAGEEENVEKVAAALHGTAREVRICNLGPDRPREFDITNLINAVPEENSNRKAAQIAIIRDLLQNAEVYEPAKKPGIFIGDLENFLSQEVPKDDPLIESLVFRGGLTGIGGVKGSHKSFFVNQLAFSYASGFPALGFHPASPGRALLIQQEVSLGFNQERLRKMQTYGNFKTGGRFFPITTTGKQLKIVRKEDLTQIKIWLREYDPDILILDPLSSFNEAEENTSRDMGRIVNVFCELKSEFNIGLVFTHHFSSKQDPNDPGAPQEAGGWFRGHTVLPDACDVLVCLHRLPGQKDNPNLAKTWEDYNLVQIQLRNGRWPERFAIEFNGETFLLSKSDVWQEIGKKILPGEIEDLLEENGGEMRRQHVIDALKLKAGITTIKKAIREAIKQGIIEKDTLREEHGHPIVLRLKS